MTHLEASKVIGATGRIDMNGLTFRVVIQDARTRWGTTDYQITPYAEGGSGRVWVEANRVTLDDDRA